MKVSKITVIGGSGFVGTNLCQSLEGKNQDFEIIDLKISNRFPQKSKIGDVRDLNSLRNTITGDVIVNLAAVHRDDVSNKSDYIETNVRGAENIANICSEKGIKKILFVSSVAVYGFARPGTDENGEIKPFNDYGYTKYEAENKFKKWEEKNNNSILVIIRPSVIFGPGNRGNVFNFLNQISSKKFVMIGDGLNKKSMVYIENFVNFLEVCLEHKVNSDIINYVDKPDMTVNELTSFVRGKLFGKYNVGIRLPNTLGFFIGFGFDILSVITGKKFKISSTRIKKFITSTEFKSSNKIIEHFDPPFSLKEGLNKTLESEFINPKPNQEVFFTE